MFLLGLTVTLDMKSHWQKTVSTYSGEWKQMSGGCRHHDARGLLYSQ